MDSLKFIQMGEWKITDVGPFLVLNFSRIVISVYDNNVAKEKMVLAALNIASNNDLKKIYPLTKHHRCH